MAIANTILTKTIWGNKRVIIGKSVLSGGSTSGDVDLTKELKVVEMLIPIQNGAAQQGSAVNEAFPLTATAVTTFVETANSTFYWIAIGTGRVV